MQASKFPNLANDPCHDWTIRDELMEAGIEPSIDMNSQKPTGNSIPEVATLIHGRLGDWVFERFWNHWKAHTPADGGLPRALVDELREKHGDTLHFRDSEAGDVSSFLGIDSRAALADVASLIRAALLKASDITH
ncbi:MAG: hypothetical protein WC897_00130 [Candidatus Gracilibacteria bacterium]